MRLIYAMSDTRPASIPPLLNAVNFRTLRASDLPSLEWEGEYMHYRNLYKDAYRRACNGDAILWVAEIPMQGLIGQAFIQLVCPRPELADGWQNAYLYGFRIKPAYRNKGIGSRMLEVIQNDLSQRRFQRLTLNVARANPDAIRLYQRLGFSITADEEGHWSYIDHRGKWRSVHEPSYRMEKELQKPGFQ